MSPQSADWSRWLDLPSSAAFRYEHPSGSFTARREPRKGALYWYAYRKRRGVVHKAYLGKARDLTAARLEEVAVLLARRVGEPRQPPAVTRTWSAADAAAPLHNLPAHLPSLIGREQELEALRRALQAADRGLLTLTGTGGSGKTRLALELATTVREQFSDGAWFVGLASTGNPDLVQAAVAAALRLRETPGRPVIETLRRSMGDRELLLVLDNCEHLVDACARLVDDLLSCSPGLRVLATSREPLRVAGEIAWQVTGLAAPDPGSPPPDPVDFGHFAAVRLFAERARAARPDFAIGPSNARAVGEICCRLGGLPLALELAAARVRALSAEEIATKLDDSVRLLTGGSRTAPTRQRTLRAALDWSHDLLSAEERALFRRLAVFAGGFDLAAAEAVGAEGQIERAEVLDLLARLVDKSLVQTDQPDGHARYRLLEPVRQYARERLTDAGEAQVIEAGHAAHFLALAENAEPTLRSADRHRSVARLETEHDNLRSALSWLLSSGEAETGVRLATALAPFWSERGHLSEGRSWLERALVMGGPDLPGALRAKALTGAGMLALLQSDGPGARALLEESLTLWRSGSNAQGAADALSMLAHAVHFEGDIPAMVAMAEQSLALYRELDDRRGTAGALGQLGHAAWHQQEYSSARALLGEALALLRQLESSGATWNPFMSVTHVLWSLGNVARDQAEYPTARSLYAESVAAAQEQGSAFHVAILLDSFASLAAAEGQAGRVTRLLGAAESVRSTGKIALAPIYRRDFYDAFLATVQAALDKETLAAVWAEGRAMSWEQAIAYGLGDSADLPAPATEPAERGPAGAGQTPYPDRLTAREVEILCLLAGGKSNPAIAQELVLSVYTVERHVINIYGKIGVHTRVEATAYALRHGLL